MLDGRRVQDLDLRNILSGKRNPIIADIFNHLKYMDRQGSGFKKMLDLLHASNEEAGEVVLSEILPAVVKEYGGCIVGKVWQY